MKTNEQTPHGEAALLDQISTLQKRLDECLDSPQIRTSHRFNAAAERIIETLFEPIKVFVPVESKACGRYDATDRKYAWQNFKQDLFEAEHLERFWVSREFRDGVDVLIKVCQILETQFFEKGEKDYGDIPWLFLFDNVSVDPLYEALNTFRDKSDISMTPEEIEDVWLSLQIILLIKKSGGLLIQRYDEDDED